MSIGNVEEIISFYFPGFDSDTFDQNKNQILKILSSISDKPLNVTVFNQLLHLNHEAGVSRGFFKYYFLDDTVKHCYSVDKVLNPHPSIDSTKVSNIKQLDWGLRRLFIDGLLFFGNIRTGFRELRSKNYEDLVQYFEKKRCDSKEMVTRSSTISFKDIPVDDRYLISEIACKAYAAPEKDSMRLVESTLINAFKQRGGKKIKIKALFDDDSVLAKEDPQTQMMLNFATEEFLEDLVENEEDIRDKVNQIVKRFEPAREKALENTRLFLSLVNELDIYIATSMRKRDDFRNMARDSKTILERDEMKRFNIRYFDPTLSAASGHEDKGLIECLMVKCCKMLLYFAGEKDSFGKDAEISMAMSLGKPVIILCPEGDIGEQREKFFRDIHPLSRLIEFETGVACGALVTQRTDIAGQLIERIFDNKMEYDLINDGQYYFKLKERLTGSIVRLQTNDLLIRETFWNYYHNVP